MGGCISHSNFKLKTSKTFKSRKRNTKYITAPMISEPDAIEEHDPYVYWSETPHKKWSTKMNKIGIRNTAYTFEWH